MYSRQFVKENYVMKSAHKEIKGDKNVVTTIKIKQGVKLANQMHVLQVLLFCWR